MPNGMQTDGSQVDIQQESLKENSNVVGSLDNAESNSVDELLPSDRKNLDIGSIKEQINLPDYIVEKMTDNDIIKYYNDIKAKEEPNAEEQSEQSEETEQTEEEPKTSEDLWKQVDDYLSTKGGIPEELYDELNKLGIPDEVIDNYIDGIKLKQEQIMNQVYEFAGGKEEFNSLVEYAVEKYGEEFVENASNLPLEQVRLLINGLKQEIGSDGSLKNRISGTKNIGSSVYTSQEDYLLDVKDSRYGRDAKYTKMVDEKFKRSFG